MPPPRDAPECWHPLRILRLSSGATGTGFFSSGFFIAGTHRNTSPPSRCLEVEVATTLGGRVHPLTLSLIWGLKLIINPVDTGIVDGAR